VTNHVQAQIGNFQIRDSVRNEIEHPPPLSSPKVKLKINFIPKPATSRKNMPQIIVPATSLPHFCHTETPCFSFKIQYPKQNQYFHLPPSVLSDASSPVKIIEIANP
jgi:hypothetical protein